MKRTWFLCILICAFIALTLLPTGAQAAVIGGVFEYTNPNGSLQSFIEADLQDAPFHQPPGSYDYPVVTSLKITGAMADADYTFIKDYLHSLATLDISGVTSSLPDYAFRECASIETIRLPADVEISTFMFLYCSSLKTLGIGSGALTDRVIDLNGYTKDSFGGSAFHGCDSIETVRLPADAVISNSMFVICSGLKTLAVGSGALADGVIDLNGYNAVSFGENAFAGCHSIETVRLPADKAISKRMFYDSGLKTLGVGSGALTEGVIDLSGYTASFGDSAFWGCTGIETVRLPADIAISGMFGGCTNLRTLGVGSGTLTDGVIDLSGYSAASFSNMAFYGCSGIETVRLPADVALSPSMFDSCTNLKTLGVGSGALIDEVIDLTGYTAPSFGDSAFYGCSGIKTVQLPADVALSVCVFDSCTNLKTLGVGSDALTDAVIDLSGYTADMFGDAAFVNCSGIETVRLPAGIAISRNMFVNCSSLKTLGVGSGALTDGVIDLLGYTLAQFGHFAFQNCTSIEMVRLPSGTTISIEMFKGCSSLTTAVFTGNTAPTIWMNAFYDVNCVACVPDKDSGGYEAAAFSQHFSEVHSISLPAFSAAPQNQTTTEGQTVSFSVAVIPGAPATCTLQWQASADEGVSWDDIAGENGDTLRFDAATVSQNGCRYRCVAASLVGSAVSSDAILTVNAIVNAERTSDRCIPRKLTDSTTGVMVSGTIDKNARLMVKSLALHHDPACDTIREAQKNGQLILGYDISLNRSFISPLTVSIPVGSPHNRETVTILHCINGRLETIIATVVDGVATFTVTALSPFAVTTGLLVPDSVVTDPPKTGDTATPWGFTLIGLAAACAGYMAMKRRRG